jgi:hypothetical protein
MRAILTLLLCSSAVACEGGKATAPTPPRDVTVVCYFTKVQDGPSFSIAFASGAAHHIERHDQIEGTATGTVVFEVSKAEPRSTWPLGRYTGRHQDAVLTVDIGAKAEPSQPHLQWTGTLTTAMSEEQPVACYQPAS